MNAAESEREQIGFKRPSFINVVPTAEVFRGVHLPVSLWTEPDIIPRMIAIFSISPRKSNITSSSPAIPRHARKYNNDLPF